jgi:hypothetical protein
MKSCNKCENFNKQNKYCYEFKMNIIDVISATVCSKYKSKARRKEKVKCVNCKNINKYNYCHLKKRCFNFEERTKERQCINFIKK